MDYKQFRETNSVSGKDMISALRELYPKYGKATQSMVDNPEKIRRPSPPRRRAALGRALRR